MTFKSSELSGSWSTKVRRGFKYQDENYLNLHDNAEANPTVQIFDNEEIEDVQQAKYYCAVCKKQIRFYHDLGEWFCNNCGQHYDTKIQDRPIANGRGFRVTPHYQISRYPTLDDEDPNTPYLEPILLDEDTIGYTEEVELIKSSPDERIKHIRVRGSLKEALEAEHLFD